MSMNNIMLAEFSEADKQRFWSKVKVGNKGECWPWMASLRTNGYGSFCIEYIKVPAHAVALFLGKGERSSHLDVCHSCDNRKCCNPNHLWLGTRSENMIDCLKKNRLNTKISEGPNHGMSRLEVEDINRIFEMHQSGIKTVEIAKSLQVNRCTIQRVLSGKHWSARIRALKGESNA